RSCSATTRIAEPLQLVMRYFQNFGVMALLSPRAEWVVRRLADCRDQFPNTVASGIYGLNELCESFRLDPFQRNVSRDFPQREQIKGLDSAQPGLERLPSGHVVIDAPAGINPACCRVREIPFFGVKAVAEVNEMSAEVPVWFSPAKHDLPAVTVA